MPIAGPNPDDSLASTSPKRNEVSLALLSPPGLQRFALFSGQDCVLQGLHTTELAALLAGNGGLVPILLRRKAIPRGFPGHS